MSADDERTEPETDVEGDETEEEQLASEWHTWLFGILLVAGIALLAAPRDIVPELAITFGPLFVALGLLGWVVKWWLARGS